MNLNPKYKELLKKGYILTEKTCPKCGSLLLRDPKTKILFCPNCGYKEDEEEILDTIKYKLLGILKDSEDIKTIYLAIKSLYLLKKLK